MAIPLFLETSKGMINLALVTHIYTHAISKALVFHFVGDAVHIPEEEGKVLMKRIKGTLGGYTGSGGGTE